MRLLLALLIAPLAWAQSTAIIPTANVTLTSDSCSTNPQVVIGLHNGDYTANSWCDVSGTATYKSNGTTFLWNAYYYTKTSPTTWSKTLMTSSTFRSDNNLSADVSIGKPVCTASGGVINYCAFTVQSDIGTSGALGAATSGPFLNIIPDIGAGYRVWASSSATITASNSGPILNNGVYSADVLNIVGTVTDTLSASATAGACSVSLNTPGTGTLSLVGGQKIYLDTGGLAETPLVAMNYSANANPIPLQAPCLQYSHASGATANYRPTYLASAGALDTHMCPDGTCVIMGIMIHSSGLSAPNNQKRWYIGYIPFTQTTVPLPVNANIRYLDPSPDWVANNDPRAPANLNCDKSMKATGVQQNGNIFHITFNGDQIPVPAGHTTVSCTDALGLFGGTSGGFEFYYNRSSDTMSGYAMMYPEPGQTYYTATGGCGGIGCPRVYQEFPEQAPNSVELTAGAAASDFMFGYSPVFDADATIDALNPNFNRTDDIIGYRKSTNTYYQITNANVSGALQTLVGSCGGNFGNLSYDPVTLKLYAECQNAADGSATIGRIYQFDMNYAGFPGGAPSGLPLISGVKLSGVKIGH